MTKLLSIGITLLLVVGGIFIFSKPDEPGQTLSMQSIRSDIGTTGQLIDVRTPEEYNAGHIDGAVNLPLQSIESGTLPSVEKDEPIYLYCRSGNRSAQATLLLKQAGYTDIQDLGAMTSVQSLGGSISKALSKAINQ
jgi:rhodanese-related sulfurtransferase